MGLQKNQSFGGNRLSFSLPSASCRTSECLRIVNTTGLVLPWFAVTCIVVSVILRQHDTYNALIASGHWLILSTLLFGGFSLPRLQNFTADIRVRNVFYGTHWNAWCANFQWSSRTGCLFRLLLIYHTKFVSMQPCPEGFSSYLNVSIFQ